ncbi:hypothetical protein R3P38DRAFT_3242698 [Favolaschia claudopus]|uniref:Uncharacterized protein n=1 Tax=Favolaschia claudopus TaxID=2862362 RepID=A0AAV9Z3Z3_9AGAR
MSGLCLWILQPDVFTVSQSLNVVFHAPAALGETLRIVNTTLTVGSRAMSARTEVS